jgi:hypothetical protein
VFKVINGFARREEIVSRLRLPDDPGIEVGSRQIHRGKLGAGIGVKPPDNQGRGGVHEPAEFSAPKVPASNYIQSGEQGSRGSLFDEAADFIGKTAPGRLRGASRPDRRGRFRCPDNGFFYTRRRTAGKENQSAEY